jgi:tetratricopeptide (TPR) repeat protein
MLIYTNLKEADMQKNTPKINRWIMVGLLSLLPAITHATTDDATALMQAGDKAYQQKQYQQALEQYKAAAEKRANHPLLLNNISVTLLHLDKPDESLKYANQVGELAKKEGAVKPQELASAYFNMGKAYQKQQDYPKAQSAYEQANTLAPSEARDKATKQMAYQQQKMTHALATLTPYKFRRDPIFDNMDKYLGYSFCDEFLKDFLAQKNIVYIMPDLMTDDFNHPELQEVNRRIEKNDATPDLRTVTYEGPSLPSIAKRGYRLYHLELDGVTSNGDEIIFMGDDLDGSNMLLRGYTAKKDELMFFGTASHPAVIGGDKVSKVNATEIIKYKEINFTVGYGGSGVKYDQLSFLNISVFMKNLRITGREKIFTKSCVFKAEK